MTLQLESQQSLSNSLPKCDLGSDKQEQRTEEIDRDM